MKIKDKKITFIIEIVVFILALCSLCFVLLPVASTSILGVYKESLLKEYIFNPDYLSSDVANYGPLIAYIMLIIGGFLSLLLSLFYMINCHNSKKVKHKTVLISVSIFTFLLLLTSGIVLYFSFGLIYGNNYPINFLQQGSAPLFIGIFAIGGAVLEFVNFIRLLNRLK